VDDNFASRLKLALTGAADTSLVHLGNFEVEREWAAGERSLPRVSTAASGAVVSHMDEFTLLLAGADDHVVLKTAPDPDYLAYLKGLGLELPTVHVASGTDAQHSVTEDALGDPDLLATLSQLATRGCRLVAHGVSTLEERLARATGLPLAAPDSSTCRSVNSKVYSRAVADQLGLRQPVGWGCSTAADLAAAVSGCRALLAAGRRIGVKEAFGVSGKGIAVVDDERRLDRLHRMILRGAEGDRISFVIEEWVAKTVDLNYQFTVSRRGAVRFDFVKEAITDRNVHKGHRMPAELPAATLEEIREVAGLLGGRLAADGYFGVVGVDAFLDPDGGLYPVVEINARHNMSTYQVPLQEKLLGPDQVALARYYPVPLDRPLPFGEVNRMLDGLMLTRAGGTGLVVNNFATVNAGAGNGSFEGRLYGVVIADSTEELTAIDQWVTERLGEP
jgi:pre ATP-grasp domain-containing protein/ATP-grasp domain-containing protein